ncbi:MAG TPA: hypothetical protein VJL29_14505 [Thermoguttaceae bacterium]|nr:hypothetical protein [Thermoguttaceae bacterium]
MADERPDFSLENVPGERGLEKPALFLVRYFQIKEADYMKPPMAEQLLEPDGTPAATVAGVIVFEACTCNLVCTCVPVSTCACNTVCTCNTVNQAYGVKDVPVVEQSVQTVRESTGSRQAGDDEVEALQRQIEEQRRRHDGSAGRERVEPILGPRRTNSGCGGYGGGGHGGYGGYFAPCF